MLKTVIFCALFALVSANYDKTKFAKRESEFLVPDDKQKFIEEVGGSRGSRISNGVNANDIAYPYAVEVTTRWRTGEIITCTGSIISTSYVITSRNCVFNDHINQTSVSIMIEAGSASRSNSRKAVFVQGATWVDRVDGGLPHPNFGLLLLSEFLIMSPTIQIVRLPSFAQSLSWFDMMPAWIAGWGMDLNDVWLDNLQHGRTIITARGQNNEVFVPGISEYELLARAAPEFPNMLIHPGDQGGPMIIMEGGTPTLIGTLWTFRMYDDGALAENMITAFRIGHFWDFIHDITGIPRRF